MSIITSENNYKRKSHRVNLPLLVEIQGKSYQVRDWSVTGLGLEGAQLEINVGDELPAVIFLPLQNANVSIKVTLLAKNKTERGFGFEFKDIEPKHKRLLRHYVEMAIEGKIDDIEGLVSVVTTPSVDSPIEDALNLTELEQGSLSRQFRIRSRLVVLFGVLFIMAVAALLFYNTTYRINEIGVVVGNTNSIYSPITGRVSSVFVSPGSAVEQGTPLYAITDDSRKAKLETLAATLDSVKEQLAQIDKMLASDTERGETSKQLVLESMRAAVNVANDIASERLSSLESAKELYAQRLITKKDLDYRENAHRQALLVLERERSRLEKAESEDNGFDFLLQRKLSLLQKIASIEQDYASLQSLPYVQTVKATAAGNVFSSFVAEGDIVTKDQTTMVLHSIQSTRIAVPINQADVLKLQIGDIAEVYSPNSEKVAMAKLIGFGLQTIDRDASIERDILNERHIVIFEPEQNDITFIPRERVDVWIRTLN